MTDTEKNDRTKDYKRTMRFLKDQEQRKKDFELRQAHLRGFAWDEESKI